MVVGLETFRKYFEGYYGDYVVIGGVACELALKSLGLDFRGTRDFDIVIVSETIARGFGIKLKQFIREKAMASLPSSAFSIRKTMRSRHNWNSRQKNRLMTGRGTLRRWMQGTPIPVCPPFCSIRTFTISFSTTPRFPTGFPSYGWKD